MKIPGTFLMLTIYLLSFTPTIKSHPPRPPVREKLLEKIEKGLKEELGLAPYYYDYIIDPCSSHPCWNGGRCESTAPGYECHCAEFFTGEHCEKSMKSCSKDLCNRGECVLRKTAPYFKCKCDYPYHGPTCNLEADVCSVNHNPCKNGGLCIIRDNNAFKCVCPLLYSGQFCEIGPNDCYRNNGLQYRGHVTRTAGGFKCLPWDSYHLTKELVNAFVSGIYLYGIGEHNFCRNPDGAEKPWCYFENAGGEVSWDSCDVPVCAQILRSLEPVNNPVIAAPQIVPAAASPSNVSFSSCGVKDLPLSAQGRIVGGKRSHAGKHPWLASLQLRVSIPPYPSGHICGGTLIGECWILTAAHCVKPLPQPQIWKVFLGKADLEKNETHQQSFDVKRIIVHEFYREGLKSLHYDVALMELKRVNKTCAKETRFVKTACLPQREFPAGKACVIAGWGRTETGYTSRLLDATVQLISEETCSDPKYYGKLVDSSMLCAGVPEGGTDSCQGDSGGPLICERNGVSLVAGVVSWGESCGLKYKPGVYADVYKLTPWIEKHIGGKIV
ncbi:hyaluronan-binding protein 2 [Spea bombifrons]|uniref:hyaluronan-binding protein 2 n=1 Tax=Spea bombifrons TaxID=233779 RepID=UPI00234B4A68|nr:hyaluronan-binding protein 2 [Spea bombifrons]